MTAEPSSWPGEEPARPRRAQRPPAIPGYEVGEIIGRGGMGVVYRARQLNVDREVALKVLHESLSGEERLIRRLQREARTTARLAHPHVVTAIDMGETDGFWWYAMEYVDGLSLAQRLRQEGRLKEREALRLFIPLVEALEHLYEHGVTHRDIKPANILIDKARGARLADLGLAFMEDDPLRTGQGGTLGTPHYISPEQAVDASTADVKSDIWSFGATLYHAVCGSPPFAGESAAEILSAVLYERVRDPRELEPTLSRGLTLVLRKCLTYEPEGRYQTPRELLLDLERVRERRSPRVRRHALDPVRGDGRRRKLLLTGMVAVLAGGLGWILLSEHEPVQTAIEEPAPANETVRHAALEELQQRLEAEPENLAQHASDLAAILPTLPSESAALGAAIGRELKKLLHAVVLEERNRAARDIVQGVDSRDLVRAHAALYEDMPARIFERTGYRLEELDADLRGTWATQEERLRGQLRAASDELRDGLTAWNGRIREEVDRLVEHQRWRTALERLDLDRDAILAAAGYGEIRLPEPWLSQALEFGAETSLYVARNRVKEQWRALDRELADRIRTRADSLRSELESRRPRLRAGEALASWFELELETRRIGRDELPLAIPDVTVAALDTLDGRVQRLREREEQLLEADAREDVAETARFAREAWSERRYDDVGRLWQETRSMLVELGRRVDAEWCPDLERLAGRRALEAELANLLLARAAERVREMDGQVLKELRIESVGYTNRRIDAGPDPLAEGGFKLEGRERRVEFTSLATDQLLVLAGASEPTTLPPEEQLGLACIYFYDGQLQRARDLLHAELAASGLLAELELDLETRVFDAVQLAREELDSRADEVQRRLAVVFDEAWQARSPANVRNHIDSLLTEFADVPAVVERKAELQLLQARLEPGPVRSVEDRIRDTFGPTEIEFLQLRRVLLSYDFSAERVGSWRRREWIFDNSGWVRTSSTPDWESLRLQRGPLLVLEPPLETDPVSITLEFQQPAGPPKLFMLSIAGFHLALTGPGLPGSDGETARYLISTGSFEDFFASVQAGEGTRVKSLLESETVHTLHFEGRSSGRYRFTLDGVEVRRGDERDPRVGLPSVEIRAWEPVRLLRAVVEAGRERG